MHPIGTIARLVPLLTVSLLALHGSAHAQLVTGDLQFSVVDSLGDPVPGVNAIVTGPNVQGVRGGATNGLGFCRVLGLAPGKILVRLSHTAYRQVVVENVLIQLGKVTSLGKISLLQRTLDMPELVISGQQPRIDPSTTTYGSNLRPSDFENLPVDRNYRNMIALLPQSNTSFFGDEVNIAGATGFENKYFVDGVEVTDPLFGTSGTNLPYNFIREIEVKAGGYEAESRSSLGGVLNVVTYSGTNELRGSVFGFYTSNRFATNRRVGRSDPTQGGFSNYDVGFGIGGPIIRDDLWFFVAYNPTYARRDVEVPGYGIYVDQTTANSFAAKLTWSASESLRLTATATGDPAVQQAVGSGVSTPPSVLMNPDSYLMDIGYGGINISLDGIYSIGNNFLIDGSISRVNNHATGDPATDRGKQETFFYDHLSETWSGGPQSQWDSFRYSTTGKLAASLIAGAHTLKLGMEYKVNGTDNRYANNTIDRYDTSYYVESFSKGYETVHEENPSVYLQDKWQISRKVSIHAGIRWDGQFIVGSNGKVAQKVTVPLQPRIGFTYVPDDDGSQKIFGSFGRFSQDFALFQSVNLFTDQGYYYGIHYNQDPRVSRTAPDTLYHGQFTISPGVEGLRGQYFDEFSIGYERVVAGNLRLSAQGLYRTLRETIDDAYIAADGRYQYGNPGEGLLAAWPKPSRDYTALIITVERREDEHFNFLASYVLSRNYGNYGGVFDAASRGGYPNFGTNFDDLPSTLQFGTGLLPNDRTHTFKLSGSYRFDFGFSTGIAFTAQSGTPLSEYVGLPIPYTLGLLAPRGSQGRTPAIWDLSVRLIYDLPVAALWRVRCILDVFHIASQRQPVDIDQFRGVMDPVLGLQSVSTYGQAYRYQPPMSVRLGMEVSF